MHDKPGSVSRLQVSRRPYFSFLAADTHDPYTVIWQYTGEVLASQMMLLWFVSSGSPHNVLHLHYSIYLICNTILNGV